MQPTERFLEYLKHLVDLTQIHHAGLASREVTRQRMMPWALKLVNVLFDEMDAVTLQTACSLHPDARRVIGYAFGK